MVLEGMVPEQVSWCFTNGFAHVELRSCVNEIFLACTGYAEENKRVTNKFT